MFGSAAVAGKSSKASANSPAFEELRADEVAVFTFLLAVLAIILGPFVARVGACQSECCGLHWRVFDVVDDRALSMLLTIPELLRTDSSAGRD
jgi:hypothetical protein